MRIGFISTRLKGTDGVSLEVEKWSLVLQRMGHQVFYCAGELGGYAQNGRSIPQLHFAHPSISRLNQLAFGNPQEREKENKEINDQIYAIADQLLPPLREFILSNQLDLIIVQNALAIPMNLPLGVSLTNLIAELGIFTIAHHHDFYWERQRFQTSKVVDLLDTNFPPNLPNIQHVTINSIAQKRLQARRKIDSVVIPNVHDFAITPPEQDAYTLDLRQALGLRKGDLFILQPTRVIQRKGIELSIELVHRLKLANPALYITHSAADEGLDYWNWLQREASMMAVDLRLVEHLVAEHRATVDGRKYYTLWDIYPHADLVTYPSLYEGFGNALLEAIYFKRLIVVNRYPVYNADIRPLGFQFVELDGYVDDLNVEKTSLLLSDIGAVNEMAEHNYQLAHEYFSLEVLERKIQMILDQF